MGPSTAVCGGPWSATFPALGSGAGLSCPLQMQETWYLVWDLGPYLVGHRGGLLYSPGQPGV